MASNDTHFEPIIERRNTNCGKWDTMDLKYRKENMIHLGVADMDFKSPEPIRECFKEIVDHGIFGYTDLSEGFYKGIQLWMKKQHNLEIPKEWIVFCPRINVASSIGVEVLTKKGDEIIINTPAYGPLYDAITKNERVAIESPLIFTREGYSIDFKQLEESITERTKMFILCSPHNPVGRVWTREELQIIGDFCNKHDLILFVDEIHSDIIAEGYQFTSALNLSKSVSERTVIATSLTKTFNIPGVIISYMIIPNEERREKIKQEIDRIGMHNPNIFAVKAVEVGYTVCDEWYQEMLQYINQNEAFTRAYFKEYMPKFKILPREGTYLLWIDCTAFGYSEEELEAWFIEKANVSVYMGSHFGEAGKGYIRLNIASPRTLLKEAYDRMYEVYSS